MECYLSRQYKHDLVIVTKTKITEDKTSDIMLKFGYKNSIYSAAKGLSSGILIL